VFFALVILGFGAAGVAATATYLDKSAASKDLKERGVGTDADVVSATEFSGRRIETYHKLEISYDPDGPTVVEFAEVQDCSGARYESGTDTVRVVYLPDDPQVVRLEACRSSFDSDVLPGFIGIAFIGFTLFMLWRLRGMWRS
jgi:hypothetical protein